MYAKRGRSVDNKYPFPGFSLSSSLGVCASAELMWGEKSLGHPHHPYDYHDHNHQWKLFLYTNCAQTLFANQIFSFIAGERI